ncbi:sialin-like [Haliotis asinina]|uniref:sialin-like n=1 Tax=Haliotis asinina TaxID=109174 RepID=UPI003531C15A
MSENHVTPETARDSSDPSALPNENGDAQGNAPASPTRQKPTAVERRALLQKQPSSHRNTFPAYDARPAPVRRLSDSGKPGVMFKRQSSFDFVHTDSFSTNPHIEKLEEIDADKVPWWTSHRFGMSIMWFFGFLCLYSQRVNLSIAIVSMVNHEALKHVQEGTIVNTTNETAYNTTTPATSIYEDQCPVSSSSKNATGGEFVWDKKLQGLILGSFFWGYLVLQVPGGWFSEKFGAKKVVAFAMFPVAIFNLLSPVAARTNPYLFLVVRVIVGLGEGVLYPAAQAFWARWSPPHERSRLIGFSYAGGQFGNAMIFPVGGYLCAYGFDGGWPSVFYVIGSVGFIWCVFWSIFASNSPADCPRISEIERKYIEYSVGPLRKGKQITPWKSIFTSRAVWAIIVAHVCGNYGIYMLLTQLPTYMKDVLKFDIKANGLFSMLPYLCFWLLITVSGTLADLLISRNILSVAWTRKLMTCIGTIAPALFLIGTGYMDCTQQTGAVVMITAAVGLCGFHFSGHFINHGDIAPRYAGTIFGITNTAATVPGILAPYVVGAMTKDGTRQQWLSTFYVAAAVYIFGALFYLVTAMGTIQAWALVGDETKPGDQDNMVTFSLNDITEEGHDKDQDHPETTLMTNATKDV